MNNNPPIKHGKSASRASITAWAAGWSDTLMNKPWRDTDRMTPNAAHNYEIGRLCAVEARAAGEPAKPWMPPAGASSTVRFPSHMLACAVPNAIPPKFTHQEK